MEENQDDITNLNKLIDEIIRESVEVVEEVQLEPQPVKGINVEQGTQSEEEEQAVTQGAAKKQRINEHVEKEAIEDDKDFISKEAQELWNKIPFDKEFVGERKGFWETGFPVFADFIMTPLLLVFLLAMILLYIVLHDC